MLEVLANFSVVTVLTAVSLLAVFVPLWRGLAVCLRARAATQAVGKSELKAAIRAKPGGREPLAVMMTRVFASSLQEADRESLPIDFALDASKQYAVNEYESHYSHVISMYANLLPPVGFIGTTTGMMILFVSMHLSDSSLEIGALAVALLSSIFALMGFAMLEALKIRLYGRLLRALDQVAALRLELKASPPAA